MHSVRAAARVLARSHAFVNRSGMLARRLPVVFNAVRAALRTPQIRAYSFYGGEGQQRRAGDWDCTSCNHLNFGRRDSCQRCGNPRGDAPDVPGGWTGGYGAVKVGDWYCGGCNAHNFASRSACFKCGADKDESFRDAAPSDGGGGGAAATGRPGWKSGDWICKSPGCSEHNFASRTTCFRCSAPREDAQAAA